MKERILRFNSCSRLAKLHQANVSLWDLGQVPEPSKNREGLSFLPKTYADPPVQPFGGLIPTLSTSLESPVNFLSMFRSTIKALSVRSGSKLGNLGKTKAIVYHVSTQKFVILAKNDIPRKSFFCLDLQINFFRRLTLLSRCTSPRDPRKWHEPRHLSA